MTTSRRLPIIRQDLEKQVISSKGKPYLDALYQSESARLGVDTLDTLGRIGILQKEVARIEGAASVIAQQPAAAAAIASMTPSLGQMAELARKVLGVTQPNLTGLSEPEQLAALHKAFYMEGLRVPGMPDDATLAAKHPGRVEFTGFRRAVRAVKQDRLSALLQLKRV